MDHQLIEFDTRQRHHNGVLKTTGRSHRTLSSNLSCDDTKTHFCFDCNSHPRGFRSSNDLDRHNRSVHGIFKLGDKYWVCNVPRCEAREKRWPRLDNFLTHVSKQHGEEFIGKAKSWYQVVSTHGEYGKRQISTVGLKGLQSQMTGSPRYKSLQSGHVASDSSDDDGISPNITLNHYFQMHYPPHDDIEIEVETAAASDFQDVDDDEEDDCLSDEEDVLAQRLGLTVAYVCKELSILDLSGIRCQASQTQSPQDTSNARSSNNPAKSESSRKREADSGNKGSKRQRRNPNDQDDHSGGRNPPANSGLSAANKIISKAKRFACPFNKEDPERYSHRNRARPEYLNCGTRGYPTIAALKQHLCRCHQYPSYYCGNCFEKFNDRDKQHEHAQMQSCNTKRDPFDGDKMTDATARRVNSRSRRTETPHDQWLHIFRILFPNSQPPPPTPYLDSEITSHEILVAIFNYLGPIVGVSLFITLTGLGASEQTLDPSLVRIVRGAFPYYETEMRDPHYLGNDLARPNITITIPEEDFSQSTTNHRPPILSPQSPVSTNHIFDNDTALNTSTSGSDWQNIVQPSTQYYTSPNTDAQHNTHLLPPSPYRLVLSQQMTPNTLFQQDSQQGNEFSNLGLSTENAYTPSDAVARDEPFRLEETNGSIILPADEDLLEIQDQLRQFTNIMNRDSSQM